MRIAVVIPTRNRRTQLLALVRELGKQTRLPECVIVVDSSDRPMHGVESPRLKVIHRVATEANLPLQRWLGVETAKDADIVAFFDDDVTPASNYLEVVEKLLVEERNGRRIGGVSGSMLMDPPVVETTRRRFRRSFPGMKVMKREGDLLAGGWGVLWSEGSETGVRALPGPAMAFHRQALMEIGPLDWLWGLYREGIGRAEDVALSTSVRRLGYEIVLTRKTSFVHHWTAGGSGTPYSTRGWKRGMADVWGRFLAYLLTTDQPLWRSRMRFSRYAILLLVGNFLTTPDVAYFAGGSWGLLRVFSFRGNPSLDARKAE